MIKSLLPIFFLTLLSLSSAQNPNCTGPATITPLPSGPICLSIRLGYSYDPQSLSCVESTVDCWATPTANFYNTLEACNQACSAQNPNCTGPATSTPQPSGPICLSIIAGYSYDPQSQSCVESSVPCWATPNANFYNTQEACNQACSA